MTPKRQPRLLHDEDDHGFVWGIAAFATFIIGFVALFALGIATADDPRHNAYRERVINENRMWHMMDGTIPVDNSGAGHMVKYLKPMLNKPDTALRLGRHHAGH